MLLLLLVAFLTLPNLGMTKGPVKIALDESYCGISNRSMSPIRGDMLHGTPALPTEFPWHAILQDRASGRFFCGGALISSNVVLTAAHCVHDLDPSAFSIILGVSSDSENGTVVPVDSYVKHNKYRNIWEGFDIAIVYLQDRVTFSHEIYPICLPVDKPDITQFEGSEIILTGTGSKSELKEIHDGILRKGTFVIQPDACRSNNDVMYYMQKKSVEGTFCSISRRDEHQDSCEGDSGGPIVSDKRFPGSYELIGIHSFSLEVGGLRCGNNYPSFHTSVMEYMDWILKKTEAKDICSVHTKQCERCSSHEQCWTSHLCILGFCMLYEEPFGRLRTRPGRGSYPIYQQALVQRWTYRSNQPGAFMLPYSMDNICRYENGMCLECKNNEDCENKGFKFCRYGICGECINTLEDCYYPALCKNSACVYDMVYLMHTSYEDMGQSKYLGVYDFLGDRYIQRWGTFGAMGPKNNIQLDSVCQIRIRSSDQKWVVECDDQTYLTADAGPNDAVGRTPPPVKGWRNNNQNEYQNLYCNHSTYDYHVPCRTILISYGEDGTPRDEVKECLGTYELYKNVWSQGRPVYIMSANRRTYYLVYNRKWEVRKGWDEDDTLISEVYPYPAIATPTTKQGTNEPSGWKGSEIWDWNTVDPNIHVECAN